MFEETYEAARAEFREAVLARGGELESMPVCEGELEAADGTSLTIDIGILGPEAPRALLATSGVHGIEGFAGSACQRQLLADGLPDDLRVVMVHAVNPYGMAKTRRVNERNVDLNRNFLTAGDPYEGCNQGYRDLESMLNPGTPHGGFEAFLLRAGWLILRHGMPALRQAVAEGQYEYPTGLFWGGGALETSARHLLAGLPRWLDGAERIAHIDFHTGLGACGGYTLLAETGGDQTAHTRLHRLYGDRVQPWDAGEGVAYAIRGGFPDAVRTMFGGRIDTLTCEFGTASQVRVLEALRAENRAHHHGGDLRGAKRMLRGAFYPDKSSWKEAVLGGGREVLVHAMDSLSA